MPGLDYSCECKCTVLEYSHAIRVTYINVMTYVLEATGHEHTWVQGNVSAGQWGTSLSAPEVLNGGDLCQILPVLSRQRPVLYKVDFLLKIAIFEEMWPLKNDSNIYFSDCGAKEWGPLSLLKEVQVKCMS